MEKTQGAGKSSSYWTLPLEVEGIVVRGSGATLGS